MSILYNNIKVVCRHYGIKIRDIESPLSVGIISRYEAKGRIHELPIFIIAKLSLASGVPIDDIVKKDISSEIELIEIREQIECLKRRAADIEQRETDDVH